MRTRHALLVVLGLGLASTGLIGCEDEDEEVFDDNTCQEVCETYRSCVDEDVDVDACEDACDDQIDIYDDEDDALGVCSDCLTGQSCNGTFECEDECANIIEVDDEGELVTVGD